MSLESVLKLFNRLGSDVDASIFDLGKFFVAEGVSFKPPNPNGKQ